MAAEVARPAGQIFTTLTVYNALPAVTLSTAGDAHGGKTQKERVTLLVGANLTGYDKLKLVFVGKAKNPRCLKHVDRDSLPVWFVEARARSGAHRSSHLTDHAAGGPPDVAPPERAPRRHRGGGNVLAAYAQQ